MNEPWDQDGGLEDDDFIEGMDDEADELGVDEPPRPPVLRRPEPERRPHPHPQPRRPPQGPKHGGPRKYRVKAMSERMAARSRGVASILITKEDGSQILFVRKG